MLISPTGDWEYPVGGARKKGTSRSRGYSPHSEYRLNHVLNEEVKGERGMDTMLIGTDEIFSPAHMLLLWHCLLEYGICIGNIGGLKCGCHITLQPLQSR